MFDELKDWKELICNTIGTSCWLGFGFTIVLIASVGTVAWLAHLVI